ncbi:YdbL family protein [Novosphingobium sp.]|uniref:YdbL family protein n=1 Tax=Novosphingobium sp. TaxID=1874826 RepID=UPI0025CE4786|nr:YdbL family protein [Novosphingobium sp.]
MRASPVLSLHRLWLTAATLVLGLGGSMAVAQSNPQYAAAKAAGEIGEKADGYVALVGGPASLRAVVDDINIKRKAVYAERAAANHATVEEYALSSGCNLITKTKPGEKYQAPDGSWQTRGAGAPLRDSRCP